MKSHQGTHFVLPIGKYIELMDGRKRQCNNFWSAFPEYKQSCQGRSPHCKKTKGSTTAAFMTKNVTPGDIKCIKLQFQPATCLSQEQSMGVFRELFQKMFFLNNSEKSSSFGKKALSVLFGRWRRMIKEVGSVLLSGESVTKLTGAQHWEELLLHPDSKSACQGPV